MSYEMYQEAILDHYRNPRNVGKLEAPDLHARGDNPLCGDEVALYLKLDEKGRVADVKFQGQGCAISQASASLLTVHLKGQPLEEVRQVDKETALKLLGIPISPVRLKCAILSVEVLRVALEKAKTGEA